VEKLLSIVIPCKNESFGLIKTIDSIKSLGGNYTIIVADCSTDDTLDLLNKYHPEVIVTEGGLPSIARNNGAKLCKTDYILFLDADMDISKTSLNDMIIEMMSEQHVLSTCSITVKNIFYKIPYLIFDLVQRIISHKTPFAVGGFMLFDRNEFIRLGGFNDQDKFAEDYHLSMKVDAKKFKIFNQTVITSDRRFRNKSVWYMVKLMTRCWINRNNDEFYKKDYNYWK